MNAKAWRLYAAGDARLEDVELEGAGEDGVVVEIVTNTICLSDYKALSLGTGHKRVPKDIATNPIMFGHEVSGIVREVGTKWAGQFSVGQHVCIQPAFNIPGHELETMGYAWHSIGGETTCVYLPSIVMEMGCLLPYDGDAYFKCSLAEPISCIVSAFRTNYHHAFGSHVHEMGIENGGTMLLMAGCGAMGLGCIDIACHSPEKRPRRLVVTDIDDARLARAARMFGLCPNAVRTSGLDDERTSGQGDERPSGLVVAGKVNGVDVSFVNTKNVENPVAYLKSLNSDDPVDAANPTSTGGGYDDIFLFAAVPALITQCSDLLAFGGCLNFFAGPTDQKLSAMFNFYNIHYMNHHIVANSGGDVKDMSDSVDWIGKGLLHPEVMITHVGGLDSAFQATLDLTKVPGGKRLVYTHVNMPMTAIADFAEKGKDDPFYAELDRICAANNGLWCKEAEDYLLANAPKVEIGAPKEKIVERRIMI
ncbi:MAG: alcohol dehydrogenase catalytic domain-containing protein [Kiritimatiellae bacterium]|nr:alcohol dehydrogenase catalytic domain-containing protein [Kiritimatiellia bacterium]